MARQRRLVYEKLVRDRIPEVITENGAVPEWRILTQDEFVEAAIAKLGEESAELRDASGPDRLGELADVWEVLRAVTSALGWTLEDVQRAALEKAADRGAFNEHIWLVAVTTEPEA